MILLFKKLWYSEYKEKISNDDSIKMDVKDQKNLILYRKVPNCMANMIPKAIYPIFEVTYRPAFKVREIKESWIKLCMLKTFQAHIDKKLGGNY